MKISTEMEKEIPKFVWQHQRPQKDKAILRNKSAKPKVLFPDFRLYYKDIESKTVQYWQKNGQTDQWNKMNSPEINLHIYGQLIYDKGVKSIQLRE